MDKLLEYLPFRDKLTEKQKTDLKASVRELHFDAGTIIHNGSEDCVGLFLVTEGQIRVYTVSAEGRELTLYRLFERDICLFSASCIMPSIQFDVTVSAEKDTDALLIPSGIYKTLTENSAAVANYTGELMASRFSDVMWLMDQIQNKKLDSRLAAFLLEESELEGNDILPLTHEKIANHLGSAREVITRMLKYFQEEGLVKLSRGSVTLTDVKKLSALAQN